VQLPRALKDEEAEIDRMTKEAAQSDIWGNELVGNAVKVRLQVNCWVVPPKHSGLAALPADRPLASLLCRNTG
jgi:hypothetical protein